MKKEKGFTLVETLAVIIILGILLIITIPAVSKYIIDSKKASYAASAQAYIETAKANYGDGQYGELIKDDQIMLIPIQFIDLEKSDGGESPFDLYDYDSSYIIIAPDDKGYEAFACMVDNSGNGIDCKKSDELDKYAVEDNLTERVNSWKQIVDGSKKFKLDTKIYSFYEKRDITPSDVEIEQIRDGNFGFMLVLKESGSSSPGGNNNTPVPGQVIYTITYNANGGKGSMSTQNKVSGIDSTIYSNGFEPPSGKYFVNWNTKANGTGDSYEENSSYSRDGNLILYAQWATSTSNEINIVTYNANGGTGSMSSLNKIRGASVMISNNGFEPPSGKTFIRWNTKSDGTGENFIAGQLYSLNKDMTLYAQWTTQVCTTGQYVNGSKCSNCPAAYPYSPEGASKITDCYLITAATKYVAEAGDGQVTCQGNNYCTGGVTIKYGETGGMQPCPETADGMFESSAGSVECSRYEAVCSRYALVFDAVCSDGTPRSGYYGSFTAAEYNVELANNSACTKICSRNGSKCKSASFDRGTCYEHVVTTYYYPTRQPTTTTSRSGNPPQGIVYN